MEIKTKEELECKISEMRKTYDGNDFTEEQIDRLMEPSISYFTSIYEESELNKRLDENDGEQTGRILDSLMDFIDRTYFDNEEDKDALKRAAEEIIFLSEMTEDLVSVHEHRNECFKSEIDKCIKIQDSQRANYKKTSEHIISVVEKFGLELKDSLVDTVDSLPKEIRRLRGELVDEKNKTNKMQEFSATNIKRVYEHLGKTMERLNLEQGTSAFEDVDALSIEVTSLRTELDAEQNRVEEVIAALRDHSEWCNKKEVNGDAKKLIDIIDEALNLLSGGCAK